MMALAISLLLVLGAAQTTSAQATPDWCYEFDFVSGQQGWESSVIGGEGNTALYAAGEGWRRAQTNWSVYWSAGHVLVRYTFAAQLTRILINGDNPEGDGRYNLTTANLTNGFFEAGWVEANETVFSVPVSVTGITLGRSAYVFGGISDSARLRRVRLEGVGANPFPANLCPPLPTSTPPPPAATATATPGSGYLMADAATPWPTPTPLTIATGTPYLNLFGAELDIAESAVAGYQYANQAGVFDLMWMALTIFIAVGGTWTVIRRLQRMDV
jgi:hypothetical protein